MELPKIHERHHIVSKADFEFTLKISEVLKEEAKNLTSNEYINFF